MNFWKNLIKSIDMISTWIVRAGGELSGFLKSIDDKFNDEFIDSIKTIENNLTPDENFIANKSPIKKINNLASLVLHEDDLRNKLIIQNIGLEPCYIKLDSGVSKDDFHFVLAPDTSLAFGNGGSITLDNWHGEVYAICEKETRLSVLEY